MHFNFDPTDIDYSRPGEALLKSGTLLFIGNILPWIQNIDINTVHIPPIFTEIFRILAYAGASVAFFKFIINLFKKQKLEDKDEKVKIDKEND
jgi:hypothetical protein